MLNRTSFGEVAENSFTNVNITAATAKIFTRIAGRNFNLDGALVIAPLDANTLAKLAIGLCDNCLTCVWRAWDMLRPVVLAPAMNTLMWEHPLTRRHLRQLAVDAGGMSLSDTSSNDELIAQSNQQCRRLHIIAPQSKKLACGDVGVGGLAEVADIVAALSKIV